MVALTLRQRLLLALSFPAVAGFVALLAAPLVTPLLVSDNAAAGSEATFYIGLVALFLAAVVGGLYLLLESTLLRPAERLAQEAVTLVTAHNSDRALTPSDPLAVGPMGPALAATADALRMARRETVRAMETATARMAEQKAWLETILLDLFEGVIVCNAAHRILLYNQAAVRILGSAETVGLGRSLFGIVTREPVLYTLEQLDWRRRESPAGAPDLSAPFVCASFDSTTMLQGRMALILDEQRALSGYVITFEDISRELEAIGRSDLVRRAVTRDLRGPIGALRAAAETLSDFPGMTTDERDAFQQVLFDESAVISDRVESLSAQFRGHSGLRWPMSDIHSLDLLNCVARHVEDERGIVLTKLGIPLWLHGDSNSLMLVIEELAGHLKDYGGIEALEAEALLGDSRIYIDLSWQGDPVPSHLLDRWAEEEVLGAIGHQTLREVLDRHSADLWSQPLPGGRAVLRIPMLPPLRPQFREADRQVGTNRPEFYDFGLMKEHSITGGLGKVRLDELSCVVFDTETTGLKPTEGDQIISLGGVRVVNRRVLTGETFERLVHPGRSIPKDSIQFHHITDEMVRGKPPIAQVLPQFKAFVGDSVLVAHNASFDMKFVKMRQAEAGVEFHNPVLDTMMLSVLLDPGAESHSLDAIADRLGIAIHDRHTALGDAMATAEILVHMFDRLIAKGLTTFDDVMKTSNMAAELRARERVW